jgi:PPP family 3-phenylpropionic acid transporter
MQIRPALWSGQMLFVLFFAFGITQSFWSIFLENRGVSASDIALVLGISAIARGLVNFFLTPYLHRAFVAMSLLFFCSMLFSELHVWAYSPWILFGLTLGLNAVLAPLIPLLDAVTSEMAKAQYLDYGKVRLWGTLGFIAGVLAIGQAMNSFSTDSIPQLLAITALVGVLMSLTRPAIPTRHSPAFARTSWRNIWSLLQEPASGRLLFLVTCLQASHGAFYSLSAIWWSRLGFSFSEISYFWGFSMVIEVLFFYFAQRFTKMMSLQTMLYVAAIAVIFRWSITAFVTTSTAIYAVQLLHGFTFAFTHLLMMRFIQGSDPQKALPLQSSYNAFAMCIGLGLVMMISGPVFTYFEHWVFVLMALLGLPVFVMPLQQEYSKHNAVGSAS